MTLSLLMLCSPVVAEKGYVTISVRPAIENLNLGIFVDTTDVLGDDLSLMVRQISAL